MSGVGDSTYSFVILGVTSECYYYLREIQVGEFFTDIWWTVLVVGAILILLLRIRRNRPINHYILIASMILSAAAVLQLPAIYMGRIWRYSEAGCVLTVSFIFGLAFCVCLHAQNQRKQWLAVAALVFGVINYMGISLLMVPISMDYLDLDPYTFTYLLMGGLAAWMICAGYKINQAHHHEQPDQIVRCICPTCGYDLRGSFGRPICPECGTSITPSPPTTSHTLSGAAR